MLTPDEIESRRAYLASLSTGDGPLQPDAPFASVNKRRWFRSVNGVRTPTIARLRLHEQILEEWRVSNPDVVRERSAILMAGPPGAGKSSTHERLFHGRDQRQWRELDADIFKRHLLEAAVADGTLQELLPPELRSIRLPVRPSSAIARSKVSSSSPPTRTASTEVSDRVRADAVPSHVPTRDV
ncbi:hypothetical protein [Prescottella equi]|uniref:hypothetical protein n=1 Tax=Rhodococcus hoagii TaxID=43767 RepID=UPI00384DC0CC